MTDHLPVLVTQLKAHLGGFNGTVAVDATLGMGGHARLLSEAVGPSGSVIGLDADPESLEHLAKSGTLPANVRVCAGNFRHLAQIVRTQTQKPIKLILMDLGLSSWQLERTERGWSFEDTQTLDMRLDPTRGNPAWWHLGRLTEAKLRTLLEEVGERFAPRLARALKTLPRGPLSPQQVRTVILKAVPFRGKLDPATKTFLALRMLTNDEQHSLKEAISQAQELLECGGRLAVISFHSLEDRIVKNTFRSSGWKQITKKPLVPTPEEVKQNPRSRSAKLRIGEKTCS